MLKAEGTAETGSAGILPAGFKPKKQAGILPALPEVIRVIRE